MAAPRSTDKWEQRRRRAIAFAIVSVLLAVLMAGVLMVAFDRGLIR
jgi:beta-lactamase regulating signal transducer with metallopeptidase domain